MTGHRVRFERMKITLHIKEPPEFPPRFESESLGMMEGVVIGVVAKLTPKTYFGVQGAVSAEPEILTYLVIGCDDGKVEERVIESVEYLRED